MGFHLIDLANIKLFRCWGNIGPKPEDVKRNYSNEISWWVYSDGTVCVMLALKGTDSFSCDFLFHFDRETQWKAAKKNVNGDTPDSTTL